jgi:phosphate transport system substrate-binding protein
LFRPLAKRDGESKPIHIMGREADPVRLMALIAWVVICTLLSGCDKSGESSTNFRDSISTDKGAIIQTKGSDTMVNLAEAWAQEYKKLDPGVNVEVGGGGSGVGIAALLKGTVDLANASRSIQPDEIEQAKRYTGKDAREYIVAYDALAIYVHKDNPLNEISVEQLAQLYAEGGTVTNWSQLGVKVPGCGNDEIVRLSRRANSGTYQFVRERVLKNKDFRPGSKEVSDSRELVDLVASTPCAIGYSGMGYATPNVKMLKVSNKPGETAYSPSVENTLNKKYPIGRSLQVYTLGEPAGALKKYVQWMRSEAGQKIVERSGFVAIPASARTR